MLSHTQHLILMVFLKDHLTSTTQMLGQMQESLLLTLEILVRVVTFTTQMLEQMQELLLQLQVI